MSVGYSDALKWLHSRASLGVRPGLKRMREVLRALHNPERELNFVHVAGTNGKGSVSKILTSLLQNSLRVGTFTSPGLEGLRADFSVNGRLVETEDFAKAAQAVMAAEQVISKDDPLTEFEALTIMSILYFVQKRADIVVWEAGLGGKSDSTNVVHPVLCVITNVSLDHQGILGHTIPDIAREKAGIIKETVPVITGATDAALAVVQQIAEQKGVSVFHAPAAFSVTGDTYGTVQTITYRGLFDDFYRLPLPLLGTYQQSNAGLALAAYELLVQKGILPPLRLTEVRRSFEGLRWEGRFEVLWNGVAPVVLDGAHNQAAARALSQSLKDFSQLCRIDSPWLMIIGVLEDKEVGTMIDVMRPWLNDVVVCEPDNGRALPVTTLEEKVKKASRKIRVAAAPSVSHAVFKALQSRRPVCCWGSLYTVTEARKTIHDIIGDS
ncbi:folylpolyglutamate synthase/dihydrofolate synthase family protein [Alicyclobacillus sp. SO9]|uniref:bifunctional folylpolyglutamate synthase/dihydrofolate synthase n=1 Tax=Alicyclobacillus sp. SO9 TaxID=2665646 RepID=UPI0018E83650|nr:Mur ligase family protein [Alicyclobacillus sp. SO9]QQE77015.1 bifunctional folylpolyglutamate synthase/dihydrofolate synthase [Alicyclobacillus sp. SO9]